VEGRGGRVVNFWTRWATVYSRSAHYDAIRSELLCYRELSEIIAFSGNAVRIRPDVTFSSLPK
jgi:hypothetical protein